eukprot:TRINITY_DN279_c0_g1_i2.p1 TRINITY_DN279_c0_g1~~TRINITY_DN279_c0_g1_i2.p1  ORF type:complete len:193 (-),score=26.10 TRINITY_DN279_c0_g1_i2:174-752(-)
MNRRFMRLKNQYVFFRGSLRTNYKNFLMMIKIISTLSNKESSQKYSFSKFFLYSSYILYLIAIIKYEFSKLKSARLNKKGPFYSFFMFKKKPIRILSFFFKEYALHIFNLKRKKNLSINTFMLSKYLHFYYVYNNPFKLSDYYNMYYVTYILKYQNMYMQFQPIIFDFSIIKVLEGKSLMFDQGIRINRIRS